MGKVDEDEIFNSLRSYNAQNVLEIFKKPEKYFEKYESYSEIKQLEDYCKSYGVEVVFLSSLARGLSYYNGSVYEVKAKKMKETVTAGGSFMFNEIQSTGLSFGLFRLGSLSNIEKGQDKKIIIIPLGDEKKSIEIATKLRKIGRKCIIGPSKITKALDYANSKNIGIAIIVGKKELEENNIKIKDMDSGKEKTINLNNLEKEFKND
jgi:histidyl-tRNA synthetase